MPRCSVDGCTVKNASWGFTSNGVDRLDRRCANHRLEGMICLISRNCSRCSYENCNTRATYGYPGTTHRIYCSSHAVDGMITLEKVCEEIGCNTIPSYGYIKKTHCALHKANDMILVNRKLCMYDNCDKVAREITFDGKRYCRRHFTIMAIHKCISPDCNDYAEYADSGYKRPIYCNMHKKDNSIRIVRSY